MLTRRTALLGASAAIALAPVTRASAQAPGWLTSTKTLISPVNALNSHILFINTATNVYMLNGVKQPAIPPPGVWQNVDFTPSGVPSEAVGLLLSGIMIITDGAKSQDTSVAACFQSPGAGNDPLQYETQTIAVGPSGGSRSNAQAIVPCVNGCIDFSWLRGNSNGEWPKGPIPAYPTGAAYGFNFNIQAVFMP